jgi:hypothetical protein
MTSRKAKRTRNSNVQSTPQADVSVDTESPPPPSLAESIEAQRIQINKAMSIIEACRLGSDSMLAAASDDDDEAEQEPEPNFEGALAAAHDLLDDALTALEQVINVHS